MTPPKIVGDVTPQPQHLNDRPCWLVAENTETKRAEVLKGFLQGEPKEGRQVVRVGGGCGVLHTVQVEHIYASKADAQRQLAAICADGSLKGIYCSGTYPSTIVRDLSPVEQERYAAWVRDHAATCSPDVGVADPARWGIRILNTQVGDGVDVICNCCGMRHEITDYECW